MKAVRCAGTSPVFGFVTIALYATLACSSSESALFARTGGGKSSGGSDAVDAAVGGASVGGATESGGRSSSGGATSSGGSATGGGGVAAGSGGFIAGGGGSSPASGGTVGAGGSAGTGGLGAGGVTGGNGGAGSTCGLSMNDPSVYPECAACAGSRCVPKSYLVPLLADNLTPCDPDSRCVPEQIVAQGLNLLFRACTSLAGASGRCASMCIPAVANVSRYLPQDVCASDERCAPCFNPADGSATGICGVGCDRAPAGQPIVFVHCCAGAGLCAPRAGLPPGLTSYLGQETCASSDVCVPSAPVQDPSYRFQCCTSGTSSGICAPACVIDQTAQGRILPQGSCTAGDKCVPCANPLTTVPTGACTDRKGATSATCVP